LEDASGDKPGRNIPPEAVVNVGFVLSNVLIKAKAKKIPKISLEPI
jgi:hypothetical protein